jgi:hypothetical protein
MLNRAVYKVASKLPRMKIRLLLFYGVVTRWQIDRKVKITTDFHPVKRLSMREILQVFL